MSKTIKRGLYLVLLVAMGFFAYQALGWLGILSVVGGGALGAIAMIPINRKARRARETEIKAPVRNDG
ncbi:hypothetical protein [Arthrobacter flavus]|uniref:Uncharacterized protein n=1 Tax=Arthrobacter flavus TaxID=95172 RepID=A0ABW4QBI1_9MICC